MNFKWIETEFKKSFIISLNYFLNFSISMQRLIIIFITFDYKLQGVTHMYQSNLFFCFSAYFALLKRSIFNSFHFSSPLFFTLWWYTPLFTKHSIILLFDSFFHYFLNYISLSLLFYASFTNCVESIGDRELSLSFEKPCMYFVWGSNSKEER
jgi:hypothetical protein